MFIAEAIIGPSQAMSLALPTGIDASEILRYQLATGKTVGQVLAETATAIGAANDSLIRTWGNIINLTQAIYATYVAGTGGRRKTPKKAEGSLNPPVRGATSGNMLPIEPFEDSLAWTSRFLREARPEVITSHISELVLAWINRFTDDMLTRIFSNTEIAFTTSGYVVPWAIGSGVNVPFIPVGNTFGNVPFDSTHTHFLVDGSGAINPTRANTMLKAEAAHLRHHGHQGMLYALVADADVDQYTGMGQNFIDLNPQGVVVVGGGNSDAIRYTDGESEGFPGQLFGYHRSSRGRIALHSHDRIPSGYSFVTKSYGENNVNNGVAVRTDAEFGFGLRINPKGTTSLAIPELDSVAVVGQHGIGINDRTNGVVGMIANGASNWVNPDFS